MTNVSIEMASWKAKVGRAAMRTIVLRGRTSLGGGSLYPGIIARLKGRKGGGMLVPPQRLELSQQDWNIAEAGLFHDLDKDFVIESEQTVWVRDEPSILKAIGRNGSLILGSDGGDFLLPRFPIHVEKQVYGTKDGRGVIRILEMSTPTDGTMIVIVKKSAGYKYLFDSGWTGTDDFKRLRKLENAHYNSISNEKMLHVTDVMHDETQLQAWMSPVLLKWMSKEDYMRLVRGGDNSHARGSEIWGDGFDHGGKGPTPTSSPARTNAIASQAGVSPPNAVAAGGRSRWEEGGKLAMRPIDRDAEATELQDDPDFGAF